MIIENLLNSALFTLRPWRGLGNYALIKYSEKMKFTIIIIIIIIIIQQLITTKVYNAKKVQSGSRRTFVMQFLPERNRTTHNVQLFCNRANAVHRAS